MSATPEITEQGRADTSVRLPLAPELRPAVKAVAEEENRVLVRCRPYATFATPRHLHHSDQEEPLTHWVSGSTPWDGSDTPR